MTNLAHVADLAWPIPASQYQPDVHIVAGYIGGDTPHVWSAAEVQAVTDTGRAWWPIWTAPSTGQRLSAAQGGIDGAGTVNALRARGIDTATPVFYDVEHGSYVSDPAGAEQAVTAWKATVHAGGWPNAFAYLPLIANHDWVAYWDGIKPASLPAGWVGKQYGGHVNPAYDLSVFDLDKLTGGKPMDVDLTENTWTRLHNELKGTEDRSVTIANQVGALLNLVQHGGAPIAPGTLSAIAAAVVAALPPSAGGAPLTADQVGSAVLAALAAHPLTPEA